MQSSAGGAIYNWRCELSMLLRDMDAYLEADQGRGHDL